MVGALLRASEVAFTVIKWVGVAYLGIRLLLSKGKLAQLEDDDPRGTGAPSSCAAFSSP